MKPTEQTNMAKAFAAAGFKPTGDRLMDLAMEAWHRDSTLAGALAREKHVIDAMRGELMWAMINQYGSPRDYKPALIRLLNDAKETIAAQRPKEKDVSVDAHERSRPGKQTGGHSSPETHPSPAAGTESKVGQARNEIHTAAADLATLSAKHAAAAAVRLENAQRLADKILINGKPLRACCVYEVRQWAEAQQQTARGAWRDWLFAQHLIANLRGNDIIGEKWRDDEMEALYARASTDYAAAAD